MTLLLPIEKQVVSPETAKLLRDAGLPQDGTVWVWRKWKSQSSDDFSLSMREDMIEVEDRDLAAPTSDELGVLIRRAGFETPVLNRASGALEWNGECRHAYVNVPEVEARALQLLELVKMTGIEVFTCDSDQK